MNPRLQELVDRARAISLTPRQRTMLALIGYPLFALLVASLTFFSSLPRERVKDRLETALSADPSTGQPLAIGMDVNIGDLSLTLLTGVGFKATDVILRTRPLMPTDKPARYIIDDARVRLGLLSTIFGRPSYSFKAHALSGSVSGHIDGNNDDTKARIELAKLVLTGVPAISQGFGGLPVEGVVNGKLDVSVPKNLLANANGNIDVDIEDVAVGDGKAKLTVPNDPFLAAGVTFPRVKIGKLAGQIVIEKGRARFEGVRVHSDDVDATLDGYVELHDPIGASQMHGYLKFRPSEALVRREPTVELMNNALAGTAKRPDGYLGLQLTGSLSAVFFLPSKDPPFGVTTRSEPATPAASGRPSVVARPPSLPTPPSPPPSNEPAPPAPPPPSGATAPATTAPVAAPAGSPSVAPPPSGGAAGEVAPAPAVGAPIPPPPAMRMRPEGMEAAPRAE